MSKKKLILILLTICVVPTTALCQDENKDGKNIDKTLFIDDHMKYLMADGGVWEAENPKYKKDEQYSAKTYKYEMSRGVHGEQFRIKILSDINSVGWWTSWDGYYLWHPIKNQGTYHSLGSNGAIATGRLTIPDKEEIINIFEVFSYDGVRSVHKDVTVKVNKNEMHSKSYKLNEKGEWEFNQKLIWKRVNRT